MKKTREESIQIVRQAAGEIIFAGKEVFEDTLYSTRYKGINESLTAYKSTLQNKYQFLNTSDDKKKNTGIDERMMEDIKELIYDSYFYEIENKLNGEDLDKKAKDHLKPIMIKEMIQAGRLTFTEVFTEKNIPKDREALPKLIATVQDFAIKRLREEYNGSVSSVGRIFNALLSGFVSAEFAQPFFLDQASPTKTPVNFNP